MNRRWEIAILALLIVGGSVPSPVGAAKSPPTAPAAAGSAPAGRSAAAPVRFRVSKPTYLYALPDPKARIVFIAMPGEELTVVASAVRAGGARLSPSGKECCDSGLYDPDQRIDIVDRVGEGYAPVFHNSRAQDSTAGAPDAATVTGSSCEGASPAKGCGDPLALREVGGVGSWVQVTSSDGRHRGWTLAPKR